MRGAKFHTSVCRRQPGWVIDSKMAFRLTSSSSSSFVAGKE